MCNRGEKSLEKSEKKRKKKLRGKVVRRVVKKLASVASLSYSLIFLCVGAQNQILGCETSKECSFSMIMVAKSKVTGCWCDRTSSSKPTVFM